MDVNKKLQEAGILLPPPAERQGLYDTAVTFEGNLLYTSGFGPNNGDLPHYEGKLGKEYSVEEGKAAARQCILNLLSFIKKETGDLNRVKRFIKMLVFVNSEHDFYRQPEVANGASELLVEIFGESVGLSARSAVGVYTLPGNIPVEIELLVELE